jgi:hypothetical protein
MKKLPMNQQSDTKDRMAMIQIPPPLLSRLGNEVAIAAPQSPFLQYFFSYMIYNWLGTEDGLPNRQW